MKIQKGYLIQLIFLLSIVIVIFILINNLVINLSRTNVGIGFQWLLQPAGFALAEHILPYKPSDSYAWALIIGWFNSLKVIFSGLLLSTFMGVVIGIARVSKNYLLRLLSSLYVAFIRQIPLLLQLMFWYFVAFLNLSETPISIIGGLVQISNKFINLLGLHLSIEFTALLVGLSVFTGASISEVIRGGINSVAKGQWEAYKTLGISDNLGMYRIILPQALPAIIPALTSQYLNLAKNSTLAIAVGYADLYAVSDTSITQTGRAIEGFVILLSSFILLNMIINSIMELINKKIVRSNFH